MRDQALASIGFSSGVIFGAVVGAGFGWWGALGVSIGTIGTSLWFAQRAR